MADSTINSFDKNDYAVLNFEVNNNNSLEQENELAQEEHYKNMLKMWARASLDHSDDTTRVLTAEQREKLKYTEKSLSDIYYKLLKTLNTLKNLNYDLESLNSTFCYDTSNHSDLGTTSKQKIDMVDSKPEEHIINSAGKCDMPLLTSNATPTSSSVGEEIPVVRDPRLEGLSNQITESLDGINAQFSRLCKTGRVLGAELNKQSRMLDCVLAANMERNDVIVTTLLRSIDGQIYLFKSVANLSVGDEQCENTNIGVLVCCKTKLGYVLEFSPEPDQGYLEGHTHLERKLIQPITMSEELASVSGDLHSLSEYEVKMNEQHASGFDYAERCAQQRIHYKKLAEDKKREIAAEEAEELAAKKLADEEWWEEWKHLSNETNKRLDQLATDNSSHIMNKMMELSKGIANDVLQHQRKEQVKFDESYYTKWLNWLDELDKEHTLSESSKGLLNQSIQTLLDIGEKQKKADHVCSRRRFRIPIIGFEFEFP